MKATTKALSWGFLAVLVAVVFALVGCANDANSPEPSGNASSGEAIELQIFAANSLEVALDKVQELYTQDHPEVTFAETQYQSSGDLVSSLKAGAPADILITASSGSMDDAAENGDIDEDTRFNMFTNELILVAKADNDKITSLALEDLTTKEYSFAIGGEGVPAGNYARQALTTTNPQIWISTDGKTGADCSGASDSGAFAAEFKDATLHGSPLIVEGSNVGTTAQYVSSGEYDTALVYSSDLYRYDGLKQVGTVAADAHKNIIYPAAVCKDAKDASAADEFLKWAYSNADAIKIWQQYGFELATK